ncbi:hypothetical protein [Spirosoma rigui]|uniref:hypothetical protein n=1 Tax=Spirosoma rigui TaxID=564064 RepID=UPI0009AFEF23|nr:hypothetical protein [Spirosoma rigui]
MKLTPEEYAIAFAQVCEQVDKYNREAESRADKLADIPENDSCPVLVEEILYWDDLYRKALETRKYLQEHEMLPAEEPVKAWHQRYEIPTSGAELAISVRNLAKNVSTWKSRLDNPKYPDAASKHGMYEQLYQEAKSALSAERAASQLAQSGSC